MVQHDADQLARRVSRRPHDRHASLRRHVHPPSGSDSNRPFGASSQARPKPNAITQPAQAMIETPRPIAASCASYSSRKVQLPGRGNLDALPAARLIRSAKRRQDVRRRISAVCSRLIHRAFHCGSASWVTITHPGSFGLDRDRPLFRCSATRLTSGVALLEDAQNVARIARPIVQNASSRRRRARRTNQARAAGVLGPPDRELPGPGPCSAPRPRRTAQLPGPDPRSSRGATFGLPRTCSTWFSTGSIKRSPSRSRERRANVRLDRRIAQRLQRKCGQRPDRRQVERAIGRDRGQSRGIGRFLSRRSAIRVPRGSRARLASTGLCSASGFQGATSINRCRPSTHRSRNVRKGASAAAIRAVEPALLAHLSDQENEQNQHRRFPSSRSRCEPVGRGRLAHTGFPQHDRVRDSSRDPRVRQRPSRLREHRFKARLALPWQRSEDSSGSREQTAGQPGLPCKKAPAR